MDDKYFQARLAKLPCSSSQTLKDVREILDILDKYNDKKEVPDERKTESEEV